MWQRRILNMSAALAAAAALAVPGRAPATGDREAVLLLHGLARGRESMSALAARLAEAGYAVSNVDYPSTDATPEELIRIVTDAYQRCCAAAPRAHFVTHSLGGVLTRIFIARGRPENLGRVVMIAPPNRGSEIVDLLGGTGLFGAMFGPTGLSLHTGTAGLTENLPAADYEVGIIAGDWPVNPLGAMVIPGRDDGGVSVEGTKLEGMADFLTVHRSHGRIAAAPEVGVQTLHFLRTGQFAHSAGRDGEGRVSP